jgi:pilus assembly protein Flp/PilA
MPRFWQDEQGQGLIEYALVLGVISITIILVLVFFKDQLGNLFSSIGNNLT